MAMNSKLTFPVVLGLALALAGAPAAAQGKSQAHGKKARVEAVKEKRTRPDLQRRDEERDRDRSWEDVLLGTDRRDDRYGRNAKGVPPGWCKGKGNPHNTPENCGPYSRRDDRSRTAGLDDIWGSRNDRYGSYEEAHAAMHRDHDRACRARAAERRLDVAWQIRVRAECKNAHDRWHARYDPRYDR